MVKAGGKKEKRQEYQSRAAAKKKKIGGLSNREKQRKKAMPLAAKRETIAKARLQKKMITNQRLKSKQFRGRKAWK